MRIRLLLAAPGLLVPAHAQVGLGVTRAPVLADEGLKGPMTQAGEKFYGGEENILSRADLLKYGPSTGGGRR